jgi:hypothetical protein
MPFTDPCDGSIAQLTNAARAIYARMQLGEIAFYWLGFNVGRYGYLDINPVKVAVIDPALTALVDTIYPTAPTLKSFEILEKPNEKAISLVCRLATSEANYGLGELGIWAKINWSSVPAEIDTDVLMAVAHVPLQSKNHRHTYVHRVIIQF